MAPKPGLPNSKETWKSASEEANALEKVKGRENASASKIGEWQFLQLRILWRIPGNPQTAIRRLFEKEAEQSFGISKDELESAREKLACLRPWQAYIKYLERSLKREESSGLSEDLGVFALVITHQQEVARLENKEENEIDGDMGEGLRFVLRPRKKDVHLLASQTPTRPNSNKYNTPTTPTTPILLANNLASLSIADSPFAVDSPMARSDGISISRLYPRALDEQIVNTALIDFLKAITIHLPIPAQWTLHRKAYKIEDWEARVDGYLQHTDTRQVKAIVEAKACVRDTAENISRIRMQEGAQMAAWIFEDVNEEGCRTNFDGRRRRVLISQDRHQIFVTFAIYNAAYISYLHRGGKELNGEVTEEIEKVGSIAKPENGKKDRPKAKEGSESKKGQKRQDNEENDSFLEMYEFGPFWTRDSNNMRYLGSLILAIVSQLCPPLHTNIPKI